MTIEICVVRHHCRYVGFLNEEMMMKDESWHVKAKAKIARAGKKPAGSNTEGLPRSPPTAKVCAHVPSSIPTAHELLKKLPAFGSCARTTISITPTVVIERSDVLLRCVMSRSRQRGNTSSNAAPKIA